MFIFKKYWLLRILDNYKRNGIKKFTFNFFNFLITIFNPKKFGYSLFFFYFSKKRRKIKFFCDRYLQKLDDVRIKSIGNYFLRTDLISQNSVILSFGVGENISFEKYLSQTQKCKIFLFDPTPIAINFYQNLSDKKNLIYYPIGIWNENKKIRFYLDEDSNLAGGSIKDMYDTNLKSERYLECKTLQTIMKDLNLNYINILKLDIEGVAIEVLSNILEENIFPDQIVCEFEISEKKNITNNNYDKFFLDLDDLLNKMKLKYTCYHLIRFAHSPYESIEVLFIKKNL